MSPFRRPTNTSDVPWRWVSLSVALTVGTVPDADGSSGWRQVGVRAVAAFVGCRSALREAPKAVAKTLDQAVSASQDQIDRIDKILADRGVGTDDTHVYGRAVRVRVDRVAASLAAMSPT